MKNLFKTSFALAFLLLLVACSSSTNDGHLQSLKDAYSDAFLMGAAVMNYEVNGSNPDITNLHMTHFNTLTPCNELKPQSLHPKPGVWNFGPGDEIVEYGRKNNMFVVGHTLCWHNQTPDFFWYNENGEHKSEAELEEMLRSYIETVCTHYYDKVDAWDVVNEIVSEEGGYRDLGWVKAFKGDGEKVLKLAFKYADMYASKDTELYYNEFNVWRPSKLAGVVNVVKMLKAEGLRIDGVGIQAHWGLNYPENHYIENAIDELHALGVKVMITELDVDVLPISKEGQVIGKSLQDPQYQLEEFEKFLDPYKEGLPAEVEVQLADRYEELFEIFYGRKDKISRVTFWGVYDGDSWKNGSPIPRRTNYPLLFQRDLTPHDAFYSVMDVPKK